MIIAEAAKQPVSYIYNSIFTIAVSCKVEVIHLPPQCIVTQGTAVNVITSDVSGTPDSRTL